MLHQNVNKSFHVCDATLYFVFEKAFDSYRDWKSCFVVSLPMIALPSNKYSSSYPSFNQHIFQHNLNSLFLSYCFPYSAQDSSCYFVCKRKVFQLFLLAIQMWCSHLSLHLLHGEVEETKQIFESIEMCFWHWNNFFAFVFGLSLRWRSSEKIMK